MRETFRISRTRHTGVTQYWEGEGGVCDAPQYGTPGTGAVPKMAKAYGPEMLFRRMGGGYTACVTRRNLRYCGKVGNITEARTIVKHDSL